MSQVGGVDPKTKMEGETKNAQCKCGKPNLYASFEFITYQWINVDQSDEKPPPNDLRNSLQIKKMQIQFETTTLGINIDKNGS